MHLVVGLGNPGPQYELNRHNVGFLAIDRIADRANAPSFREKFKGAFTRARLGGEDVVLLKPMTFMNLSGESVRPAMDFFKIDLEDVIVIHDELDIDPGVVRIKSAGGTAGHNGLKSIVKHCGGPGFQRIRVGIGRPPRGNPVNWVLGDFDEMDRAELPDVLDRVEEAIAAIARGGVKDAMNKLNRKG